MTESTGRKLISQRNKGPIISLYMTKDLKKQYINAPDFTLIILY